jgi:hypothetical protein
MARRASRFSELDESVIVDNFYLDADGRYWEEEVFTDEAGFSSHVGPATEAGIMAEHLASSIWRASSSSIQ